MLTSTRQAEGTRWRGIGRVCLGIPPLLGRLLGPVPCRTFELQWFLLGTCVIIEVPPPHPIATLAGSLTFCWFTVNKVRGPQQDGKMRMGGLMECHL